MPLRNVMQGGFLIPGLLKDEPFPGCNPGGNLAV